VDKHTSLGEVFRQSLSSPWGIAINLVLLGGLVAMLKIDWARIFGAAPEPADEGQKPDR
jgi:hypothetical protein